MYYFTKMGEVYERNPEMTVCRLKCAVLAVVASAVGVAFGDIIQPAGTAAKNVEAIQAAIDAAGTGGMVELGAGTFEIDAQLLVANGVTLVGQGREQTTLKLVPQTPGRIHVARP